MKLIKETSPYIHRKSSVKRMMVDVLIALLPIVVFAVVRNGWNAIYVILLSLVTMVGAEFVFVYLTKQDPYDGTKKKFFEKNRAICPNPLDRNPRMVYTILRL